jgi:hypothetical protein
MVFKNDLMLNTNFKEKKYKIVKKTISSDLANFIFNYFLLKRNAVSYMYKNNLIPEISLFGTWKDEQVPNVYSHYADFAMETLLMKVMPIVQQHTELELVPTYSYARIYEKGSVLKKHKDRPSCEISVTLNLGGDSWPIFLETKNSLNSDEYNEIKVDLEPGDMLIYSGCELEHWREEFQGNVCAQVFLHYNHVNGQFKTSNLYDKRPLLRVPSLR